MILTLVNGLNAFKSAKEWKCKRSFFIRNFKFLNSRDYSIIWLLVAMICKTSNAQMVNRFFAYIEIQRTKFCSTFSALERRSYCYSHLGRPLNFVMICYLKLKRRGNSLLGEKIYQNGSTFVHNFFISPERFQSLLYSDKENRIFIIIIIVEVKFHSSSNYSSEIFYLVPTTG